MDCEPLICSVCRGVRYPRQCRNSRAWREGQQPPSVCPFGVALNGLPIGDNHPSPEATDGKRSAARQAPTPWCARGQRAACCSKKFECRRDPFVTLVLEADECNPDCPYAAPRTQHSALTTPHSSQWRV